MRSNALINVMWMERTIFMFISYTALIKLHSRKDAFIKIMVFGIWNITYKPYTSRVLLIITTNPWKIVMTILHDIKNIAIYVLMLSIKYFVGYKGKYCIILLPHACNNPGKSRRFFYQLYLKMAETLHAIWDSVARHHLSKIFITHM